MPTCEKAQNRKQKPHEECVTNNCRHEMFKKNEIFEMYFVLKKKNPVLHFVINFLYRASASTPRFLLVRNSFDTNADYIVYITFYPLFLFSLTTSYNNWNKFTGVCIV